MIFREPIPFEKALAAAAARSVLPSSATSSEMREQFGPVILERAWASARVDDARILDSVARNVTGLISPAASTASGRNPINRADARLALKQTLASLGWTPEANGVKPGSLQDLTSDRRLNLILDTNASMLRGQAHHEMALSDGALAARPAQELYRRIKPKGGPAAERDWKARWSENGGTLTDGRMIALVTDPIWERISRFGLPHPPFDFNSGMDVRPVSYSECKRIGFPVPKLSEMKKNKPLRTLASRTETAMPTDPALAKAVQEAFKDRAYPVQTPKGPRLAIYPDAKQHLPTLLKADTPAHTLPIGIPQADILKQARTHFGVTPAAEIRFSTDDLRKIWAKHGPGGSDGRPINLDILRQIQTLLRQEGPVVLSRKDAGALVLRRRLGPDNIEIVLTFPGKNIILVKSIYRV